MLPLPKIVEDGCKLWVATCFSRKYDSGQQRQQSVRLGTVPIPGWNREYRRLRAVVRLRLKSGQVFFSVRLSKLTFYLRVERRLVCVSSEQYPGSERRRLRVRA